MFKLLFSFAIACIFWPVFSHAQVCTDDLCIPREIIIKTSLTGPAQHAAYVTLGAEVPIYKQIAVQAEGIYTYKYIFNETRLNHNRHSAGFKVDMKYYLPKSTTLRIYTGPSLCFRNLYTNTGRIEWWDEMTEEGYAESMPHLMMENPTEIKTANTDILWQIGVQPFILNHFALNIYTGAGLGIETRRVLSGPQPNTAFKHKSTYFSKIFGVQAGFAF